MRDLLWTSIMTILIATSEAFADAETLAGIKAGCSAEWPGDYSMQEFCINNQVTSYNHLVQIHNSDQNDEERDMLVKCLGEWETATGSDWAMVEFCYQNQHEAYERLKAN